jgi:hypothetical protein
MQYNKKKKSGGMSVATVEHEQDPVGALPTASLPLPEPSWAGTYLFPALQEELKCS